MSTVRDRNIAQSMWRGLRTRCPHCGEGGMFRAYLKVADECSSCGEVLSHQRADDAPPYFVMMIVGHIIVAAVLGVEIEYAPPLWLHAAIWIPLTIALSLALLPPVKGAIVGLQWATRMHGFGGAVAD